MIQKQEFMYLKSVISYITLEKYTEEIRQAVEREYEVFADGDVMVVKTDSRRREYRIKKEYVEVGSEGQ